MNHLEVNKLFDYYHPSGIKAAKLGKISLNHETKIVIHEQSGANLTISEKREKNMMGTDVAPPFHTTT